MAPRSSHGFNSDPVHSVSEGEPFTFPLAPVTYTPLWAKCKAVNKNILQFVKIIGMPSQCEYNCPLLPFITLDIYYSVIDKRDGLYMCKLFWHLSYFFVPFLFSLAVMSLLQREQTSLYKMIICCNCQ